MLETGNELDLIILHASLDNLSTSDVAVHAAVEVRWREDRGLSDVRGIDSALKHMVPEQRLDELVVVEHRARIAVHEGLQCIIARCQNGDIFPAGQGSREIRIVSDEVIERRQ